MLQCATVMPLIIRMRPRLRTFCMYPARAASPTPRTSRAARAGGLRCAYTKQKPAKRNATKMLAVQALPLRFLRSGSLYS